MTIHRERLFFFRCKLAYTVTPARGTSSRGDTLSQLVLGASPVRERVASGMQHSSQILTAWFLAEWPLSHSRQPFRQKKSSSFGWQTVHVQGQGPHSFLRFFSSVLKSQKKEPFMQLKCNPKYWRWLPPDLGVDVIPLLGVWIRSTRY